MQQVADTAQQPATDAAATPDKDMYNLFDPTPDTLLRSFCTDRPTKSSLPCTVDAGHFQYEADAFNWTHFSSGNTVQNTYLFSNPTFKLGLTNRSDIELNIAPYEEITTRNTITHTTTHDYGVGDAYVRYKYNLLGDDSGNLAITLYPYVKVPTAAPGVGNKAFEEGLIVPVSYSLPKGFLLVVDPEVDSFKDTESNSYHANYQGLINISHTVFTDSITAEAELWGDANKDPADAVTQTSFDMAMVWLARPNLQFDTGVNIGLNRATPDLQGYVGISQRF